jgi:TetR/AcrR family transcriptional repressor of nem operon
VGRIKQYSRDDILEKAMQLFWLHGYRGVSTRMLVDEMAVNKKSVYSEFGSKQNLFHAALDRYLVNVVPERFAALNAADAGLSAVSDTLDRFAGAASRKGSRKGCFLCNASLEMANEDKTVRDLAQRYHSAIKASFSKPLDNSRNSGELPEEFDVDAWSSFLTTTAIGVFALIRSGADSVTLGETAELVKSQLYFARSDRRFD